MELLRQHLHAWTRRRYEDKILNADKIVEILQTKISEIKSRKTIDKELIKFLCGLISYKPMNRLAFENIYRNKWVNESIKEIEKIFFINENDEEKLILELHKGDYLVKKKNKYYETVDLEEIQKNIIKESPKVTRYRFKKKQ